MAEEIGELRTKEFGILKIKDNLSLDLALKQLQIIKQRRCSEEASPNIPSWQRYPFHPNPRRKNLVRKLE